MIIQEEEEESEFRDYYGESCLIAYIRFYSVVSVKLELNNMNNCLIITDDLYSFISNEDWFD